MNTEAEAKLARITELLDKREQINAEIEAILIGKPEEEPEPVRRHINKVRKIASPPRIANRPYKREDVERDIEAGKKAKEIAKAHGIEPSTAYQIKYNMNKPKAAHPWRTSKPANLSSDMKQMIQDLRAEDKTTTEIAGELGLTFDQVASVPARGALGAVASKARQDRPAKDPLIRHSNRVAVSLDDDEDDLTAFGEDNDD